MYRKALLYTFKRSICNWFWSFYGLGQKKEVVGVEKRTAFYVLTVLGVVEGVFLEAIADEKLYWNQLLINL